VTAVDHEEATDADSKHSNITGDQAENKSSDYEEEEEDEEDGEEENSDDNKLLVEEIEPTPRDYEQGFCVLDNRISCGEGGFSGDLDIPCARNTRPQPVATKKEIDILREVCPEFVQGLTENETPSLCCDLRGLRELKKNYEMPKQLGLNRCPSCFYNFRRIFCNSACSPQQSKFLRVEKTVPVVVGNYSLQQVQELTYFVEKRFADGLYDSCKSKY